MRSTNQAFRVRRRLRTIRGRTAVVCAVLAFCAIQLGLNLLVECRNPTIYDDEFSVRLPALQARLAEAPGQPLLLMIGSSRCGMGYMPEVLPPLQTPSGEKPVLYNFAHQGSGPIFNLVLLRRLLRRGICPRWLVLEVMPPCLNHEYHSITTSCGELADLPTALRYFSPIKVMALVARLRLFPCYRQRIFLCDSCLAPLAIKTVAEDLAYIRLLPLGGDDGWWLCDEIEDERRTYATLVTRFGYRPRLQQFQIRPAPDAALRETLELCRDNGIEVVLLLMPEGRLFQSWYAPWALPRIDSYCQDLSRQFGAALVDARHWLPDDIFTDSHHPLRAGAKQFTERLGREVLEPLIQGSLSRKRPRETP